MSTPSGRPERQIRPERQSRARAGLNNDPEARTPTSSCAPAMPTRTGGPATPSLPQLGPERAVDLDRLRASAASALSAEQAPSAAGRPGVPTSPRSAPDGPKHAAPKDPTSGMPGWLRIALPIGVVAALATVGITVLGGGSDETAAPAATTVGIDASTTPSTSGSPETTAATADPTTSAAETTTTAAPPAAAAADATEAPHHKATYRGGKLYLEGRITSDAEAQKYVEKAAAVLGPDNVVNNYVIDPTVPLSTDGTVYVDEPFLFETGSSDLNPQYTGVLGLGVAALKLNPAARMVVTGYTDSKGDPTKNQQLSLARANAVVDYMVTTGGIDRARFDAIGAGDQNPVGDNATEEGRALNRRIDVKLVNLLG